MMALADVTARLVTVYLRGRSLAATTTPVIAAPVPACAGAELASQPGPRPSAADRGAFVHAAIRVG